VRNRWYPGRNRKVKVEWDFEDRLVKVTKADGTVVENALLRARTFHTSAYATASARDSWRNLRDGKAGLLRETAIARHRSVRGKTRRTCVASGGCQLRWKVGSCAEVHLVRGLAMEGRVRHAGVVLLDVELHEGAESSK
jgi:hypothetical protein